VGVEELKEGSRPEIETEEKKRLRPYRRLVGVLFAVAIVVGAVVILRGIIRHLDRMPSADTLQKPQLVDVRALRACAEDLKLLEAKIREAAATALSTTPAENQIPPTWESLSRPFVLDRISIEARCRLNEKGTDPVVQDLDTAASEIDAVLSSYQLLYSRNLEAMVPHAQNAQAALKRALDALSVRDR
jgi:hypothetical protein